MASDGVAKVRLTLDWKPEPEFGGFYAAKLNGAFERHKLDVDIRAGSAGTPIWQLVADRKTEFATTAADQVLIARDGGADVVALFAVYQKCPQAVMTRADRGFTRLQDVFKNPVVLAAQKNPWLEFCTKKYAPVQVQITGYDGGVGAFLARTDYAQQCFVFSEPIVAETQDPGSRPQTFLVSESGFNPYTTVVITSGETLRTHPQRVCAMIEACREGWRAYLDDPAATNAHMHQLNPDFDLDTFNKGAAAQKSHIEDDWTKQHGLGAMDAARWTGLGQQLQELGLVKNVPRADHCFVDPATLK